VLTSNAKEHPKTMNMTHEHQSIDQKPATAGLNGTDLPNRTTQVAAFGYIF
jgi:hypothetical protein